MGLSDFYLLLARARGRSSPDSKEVRASDLGLLAGAKVLTVPLTALTLDSDAHHGRILDFTSSSAVTVTIPAGLRPDFFCGISQGGTGQVTVSPDAGVTLSEQNSFFKTAQRLAMLSVIAFTLNDYRLFGNTSS